MTIVLTITFTGQPQADTLDIMAAVEEVLSPVLEDVKVERLEVQRG